MPDDLATDPNKTSDPNATAKSNGSDGKQWTMEDLVRGMQWLATQNKRLLETVQEQQSRIDDLQHAKPPTSPTAEPPKDTAKELSDRDIETMSQAELHRYTLDSVVNRVKNDLLEPIVKRFQEAEDRFERRHIGADLEKIESREPDFRHFRDEVKQVLDKHPDLSLDEAYGLARHVHSGKAEALAKKAEEEAAAKAAEEQKTADAEFGGLLPTSGKLEGVESMEVDQAVEAAWEKHMTGTPFEKILTDS